MLRRRALLAASAFLACLSLVPGGAFADSKADFLEALAAPNAPAPEVLPPAPLNLATCYAVVNCGSTSVTCSGTSGCIPTPRACPGQRGSVSCNGVVKYCPLCGPSEVCGPELCVDGATCNTDNDCGCTQYGSCTSSKRCSCR